MKPLQCTILALIIGGSLCFSIFTEGVSTGLVTVTATTALFVIGVSLTVLFRYSNGLPLIPACLFKEPAVISTLIYFAIGVGSGIFAADQKGYTKEVVQRTVIIFLPAYMCACGLRKTEHAKYILLAYAIFEIVLAGVTGRAGAESGFSDAVQAMNMHKNHLAGIAATMASIAVAILISGVKFIKIWKLKIPGRILGGVGLALGLLAIVAAQGRAGFVSVVVATFMMLIAVRAKPQTLAAAFVTCVGGCYALLKILPEKAVEHVVSTSTHSANAVRIELWSDMLSIVCKNPFIASGWGNPYIDPQRGWYFYDLANVLLFDWMQMSVFGAIALLTMMFFTVKIGIDNARRIPRVSLLGFVNLAALGMLTARFTHAFLDTFWIGRGVTLQTWIAAGIMLYVKLLLDQQNKQTAASPAVRPGVKQLAIK